MLQNRIRPYDVQIYSRCFVTSISNSLSLLMQRSASYREIIFYRREKDIAGIFFPAPLNNFSSK